MAAPQRKPGDAQKFRKEWLANLALSASNNQLNQNASNMFKQTGASSLVRDMTTPTERTAKAEGDKHLVRDFLSGNKFMNSYTAGETANNLLRPDELRFILEYQDFITTDFKPREIPAEVFVNYLRKLREKVKRTQGVEYGLQETSAYNLLGGLSVTNLAKLQEYRQLLEESPIDEPKKVKIRQLMDRWEDVLLKPEDEEKAAALGPEELAAVLEADSVVNGGFPDEGSVRSAFSDPDEGEPEVLFVFSDEVREASNERKSVISGGRPLTPENDPTLGLQPATSNFERGLDFASAEERGALGQRGAPPGGYRPISGAPSLFSRGSPEPEGAAAEEEPQGAPTYEELRFKRTAAQGPPTTDEIFAANISPEERADIITHFFDMGEFNDTNGTSYGVGADSVYSPQRAKRELAQVPDDELMDQYRVALIQHRRSRKPEGSGMKGTGLGKKKKSAVERSTGYVKPQPYTQLGAYLINKNKLKDGVLMVKYPSGQRISKLPTQAITKELVAVINVLMEGKQPTIRQFQVLNEAEKDKLHQIVRSTGLGVDVPNPKEEQMDKELNRFEILKGEIIAGNDNSKIIKEFKMMLIKFGREGRIPRREVNSILEEMLHMGH